MTPQQIIDTLYPYTPEDMRCGFKKAQKARKRADVLLLIDDYRQGKQVVLPDEVKALMDESL
jgi:hypothetical protein